MKKWTIALCICALLASLSGCAGPASEATTSTAATQTTAASSERNPIPENVIMGQVSAIDGTMLTLNLGEMGGRGGFGGMGQMPQNGELPEGKEKPADG